MTTMEIARRTQADSETPHVIRIIETAMPPASSPTVDRIDESMSHGVQRVFDVVPLNIANKRRRVVVTTLLILTNLLQNISNCIGIVGGLEVGRSFGVSGAKATWIAASYPLTQGTFVLVSGRLGAIFGHKCMLMVGGAWFIVFTLIDAFVTDFVAFCAVRALSGIGGAMILPNCVAMIGITNPPGPARNVSLGLIGASAPMGGYLGGVIVGLFIEYSEPKWSFVFVALVSVIIFALLWMLTPGEVPVDRGGKIDYVGIVLGTSALILVNLVWNQAPAAGWQKPYEYTLLLVAVALFVGFIFWERRTPHPILPLSVFKAPSFGPLLAVVLLNFMALGTILWYMLLWLQNLRHWTVLSSAIAITPFCLFAVLGSVLAAWLVPRLDVQWIIAIGSVTAAASGLILATMPKQQTYWAQVFPAATLLGFCPDLTYTAAQIIASNAVRREEQGVAASLVGTLNLYGVSLGLGFASTVETQITKTRRSLVVGYSSALYFGLALAIVALVLDLIFVRLVKDDREGWQDEDLVPKRRDERACSQNLEVDGFELQIIEPPIVAKV